MAAQARVDPDLAGAWRLEVGRLRGAGRHRLFPMGVHLGIPAGPRVTAEVSWPVPARYDAGLRFDIVDALIDRWQAGCDEPAEWPWLWLTRPGVPQLHDRDLEWRAAGAHAFAAHDRQAAGHRVVTRSGWFDIDTDDRRTWKRLRL